MKYAKAALLAILLISVGCVTPRIGPSKIPKSNKHKVNIPYHPDPTFYKKSPNWEGPINPHEVLRYWIKLSVDRFEGDFYVVTVGNPKQEWSKWGKNKDPLYRNVLAGEITAAVNLGFYHKGDKNSLAAFRFVDRYGVDYYFVWDKTKKRYIRFLDPDFQVYI